MKWQRGYQSRDVIDQRGKSGGGFNMLGPALALGSKFGIGGIIVVLGLLFVGQRFLAGGDPSLASRSAQEQASDPASHSDEKKQFVSFVFDDAQRTWEQAFENGEQSYQRAKLVLFTDNTASACGFNSANVGPFYCPQDLRVYIELGFYRELERRFGAPGDFAQAYVIAHEVGHHVQTLLGLNQRSPRKRNQSDGAEGQSVRFELQADCFAGIWAHSTNRRDLLESGDIEEGLAAAAAIGDDRLQKQSTGRVNPESWTHGSAEQRVRWFRRGYETGNVKVCDTFEVVRL